MDWLRIGSLKWGTLFEAFGAHVVGLIPLVDVHAERGRFPDLMTPPQSFALFVLVAWRLLTRARKPTP
jgi:hypothetical protein